MCLNYSRSEIADEDILERVFRAFFFFAMHLNIKISVREMEFKVYNAFCYAYPGILGHWLFANFLNTKHFSVYLSAKDS
jgi:hypothetical protein